MLHVYITKKDCISVQIKYVLATIFQKIKQITIILIYQKSNFHRHHYSCSTKYSHLLCGTNFYNDYWVRHFILIARQHSVGYIFINFYIKFERQLLKVVKAASMSFHITFVSCGIICMQYHAKVYRFHTFTQHVYSYWLGFVFIFLNSHLWTFADEIVPEKNVPKKNATKKKQYIPNFVWQTYLDWLHCIILLLSYVFLSHWNNNYIFISVIGAIFAGTIIVLVLSVTGVRHYHHYVIANGQLID